MEEAPYRLPYGGPFNHLSMLHFSGPLRKGPAMPMDLRWLPEHLFRAETNDGYEMKNTGNNNTGNIHPYLIGLRHLYFVCKRLEHLLSANRSLLSRDKALSVINILFESRGDDESLASKDLARILPWLLTVSAWQANIQHLDHHLRVLVTQSMSNPSLATFRPIPILRQHVADLCNALQEAKDCIGKEDNRVFDRLQAHTGHQLESLDKMFDVLVKQAEALFQTASNEIQLVIGSVAIQVTST